MLSRDARYLAAALQAVIAWEWLVSGTNKLLSGTFPQGLAGTLSDGIKNNPNAWYVAFLDNVVMPHSVAFGYMTEFGEIFIGLGLLIGTILLLGPVRHKGSSQYRLALVEISLAAVAALACAFLCINFHFFMGDGLFPGIDTSRAFDEGISLDTLMPPLSLLVLYINIHVLCDMTGTPMSVYLQRGLTWIRRLATGNHREVGSATETISSPR